MAPSSRPPAEPGLVLVDKPAGWTSHDVIAKMRGMLGTKKVGHAGTLDPMATGLLVVAVGKGTKLLTYIAGQGKAYTATIRLGQATVTDDAEGDVTAEADASAVTDEAISAAVADVTGDIMQVPSAVSAIKIDGKRSYARVRAGEDVKLAPRPATVSYFNVGAVRREGTIVDVDAEVEVSSGTYVRALARDLGSALGVGGHLTALRRTRVGGDFRIEDALTMDQLQAKADAGGALVVHSLAAAAAGALPVVPLDDDARGELRHGRSAPAGDAALAAYAHAAGIAEDGALVAIVRQAGDRLKPVVVFDEANS